MLFVGVDNAKDIDEEAHSVVVCLTDAQIDQLVSDLQSIKGAPADRNTVRLMSRQWGRDELTADNSVWPTATPTHFLRIVRQADQ